MTATAMLVMLLSLSPLPLPVRSPCRCGRAHRNAARRSHSPPPPCSLFIYRLRRHYACRSYARRAAVAAPGAAMLAVRFCGELRCLADLEFHRLTISMLTFLSPTLNSSSLHA
ncbi:hypothetical protein PF006_g32983, partial [Phytophthora fragariae]